MYTIGEFSKINRITTKTLRHYDKIGLLKPKLTDKFTGYRYYSSEQLLILHKILSLKQMGFSLINIKILIENDENITTALELRKRQIEENIKQEKLKLSQVDGFINSLKKGELSMYSVVLKELPEVKVASYRKVIDSYDELFNMAPNVVGPEMRRVGCVCAKPEYCFNIYHDGEYRERNIDTEMCQAIVELKEDTDILKFKVIEKVDTAACLLHKGPYNTLGESYANIFKWIEENNYKVIDNPRESYIDGIWNKDDESEWLTEIQVPVVKK